MLPEDLDTITWHDFTVLLHANQLREIDTEYAVHKQAFLNQLVKQVDGTGKNARPRYPTLKSLYDYTEELDKIQRPAKYKAKVKTQNAAASFALTYNQGGPTDGK